MTMGQGRPTSRPSNYITDLEVLLEAKNERIEELEVELRRKTIAHGAHLIEENVQLKRKYEALVDNIMEYLDVDAVEWATESGDPPVDIVDFANSIRALLEVDDE